jgi:hypothetical protein
MKHQGSGANFGRTTNAASFKRQSLKGSESRHVFHRPADLTTGPTWVVGLSRLSRCCRLAPR